MALHNRENRGKHKIKGINNLNNKCQIESVSYTVLHKVLHNSHLMVGRFLLGVGTGSSMFMTIVHTFTPLHLMKAKNKCIRLSIIQYQYPS